MTDVFINNIATFLPNAPVDNDAMEAVLGQIGDRPSRARRAILRNNGINTRHYAVDPATGERTHTNAELTAAAIRALANDGFDLNAIDCLACGTTIADQLMPNHAVMVHGELGTPPCEVAATTGVCVSGITSLRYASLGVAAGEFENAVATASELSSAVMAADRFRPEVAAKVEALARQPEIAFEKDFLRWMLSDGAGAMLLQPQPREDGVSLRLDWIFERSYAHETETCMYAGAEKRPDGTLRGWNEFTPQEWLDRSVMSLKQDVKLLNEQVIHYTVEKPLRELIASKGIAATDYDWWFTNLTTRGNTGSASIYIILEELLGSGRLEGGQRLLCYIPESGRFTTAFMQLTVMEPDARK